MTENIIENNKMIAEFMGYKLNPYQNSKSKSKACSEVLQLMDSDFEYQEAITKVLSDNKELSKTELEKELNLYI